VPPSKARSDPDYDDRLLCVLRQLAPDLDVDVRELVLQRATIRATHESAARPRPEELYANYHIDESVVDPTPQSIAVFDDLLTTGSHFRAMAMLLSERFPGVPIVGLFVARRVPDTTDVEDLF
jgi:hypothetical protein